MLSKREHIYAHALRHTVTLLLKVLQVPDQRLGITGDVDDPLGADLGYGIHEFFGVTRSGYGVGGPQTVRISCFGRFALMNISCYSAKSAVLAISRTITPSSNTS